MAQAKSPEVLGPLAPGLAPPAKPPELFSKLENQTVIEARRKFWRAMGLAVESGQQHTRVPGN